MKKVLTVVIALVLCVLILPLKADAAYLNASGTCGDNLTWLLDDEGQLTILGTGTMYDYENGDAPWYGYKNDIKYIVIEDGVTNIGKQAFYGCDWVRSVIISNSVTRIENKAFYNCSLWSATIPDSVTYIGDYAFYGCTFMDSLILGNNIAYIGECAFYGCDNLTTLTIPSSVTQIGNYAFSECTGLRTLEISDGVPSVGKYAFERCFNLNTVAIPKSTTHIDDSAFEDCFELKTVIYCGTEDQWQAINIGANNEFLQNATFNCHSYLDPTCEDPYTCVYCGATYGSSAHKWMSATCNEPQTCYYCGAVEGDPLGHTFTDVADDTCDVCGLFVLRGCVGESLGVSITTPQDYNHYVSGNGSDKVTMVYTGQSGVSIPGYTKYSKNYQLTFSEPGLYDLTFVQHNTNATTYFGAEITDHDWNLENHYDATCNSKGYETYICNQCYTTEQRNFTDMIPHSWKDATCTAPKTCKVCGATEGSALGHTEVIDKAVEATCTTAGKTEGKHCSVCNTVIVAQQNIPAKGHDWKNATCTAAKTCKTCGATEGSALGHTTVVDPAVEPTCTAVGKTEGKHCSVCNAVLVEQQATAPKGHEYSHVFDYKCNVCSYERTVDMTRPMVDMFRMYDPNSGEHFYTGSMEERENLVAVGWQYEGVGFTFPLTTGKPVHRLYDPATGEHLYTMDVEEMNELLAKGWNYEGIAFNSGFENEVPQYRLHNPNATRGAYHFTASLEERDMLMALGWEYQGIGWYSLGA